MATMSHILMHAHTRAPMTHNYDNDILQLYFLCWQERDASLVCLSNKAVPGNPAEKGRSPSFAFLSNELSVHSPGRSSAFLSFWHQSVP